MVLLEIKNEGGGGGGGGGGGFYTVQYSPPSVNPHQLDLALQLAGHGQPRLTL